MLRERVRPSMLSEAKGLVTHNAMTPVLNFFCRWSMMHQVFQTEIFLTPMKTYRSNPHLLHAKFTDSDRVPASQGLCEQHV